MWYIHYWRQSDGSYFGFVDADNYVGEAPGGGRESIKGPYSSKAEAERELARMRGK